MIRKMMAMYDAEAQSKTCGCRRHVIVPPTMLTIKALPGPIDSAAATTHRKRLLVVDAMSSRCHHRRRSFSADALLRWPSYSACWYLLPTQIDNRPEICNCQARVRFYFSKFRVELQ